MDCGPLAALYLLAACVVGLTAAEIGSWSMQSVTVAGKYLRCRIAQDAFGLRADQALSKVPIRTTGGRLRS